MNRELWIMRHGKAERFDGIEDYGRQLKKRGRAAAKSMARWVRDNSLRPDLIISSPAPRALATAGIMSAVLQMQEQEIIQDKRLYDEGLVRVKSVLAACAADYKKVLLVGHNPELESLLHFLLSPAQLPPAGKLLPTAGLARLSMPDDWLQLPPHCAQLLTLIHPKTLIEGDLRI